MNIWIKRSLGTVAVTGGLVLAGAAAASADDASSTESSNSSESSLSSPIEIGAINVGSSSESSSSSSSESSTTDGDRSSSTQESSSESSSNDTGLSTGPITVDPQAALQQQSESEDSDVRSGDRDGSSSESESSAETSGSASAPISVGGLEVTSDRESESADASERTVTDGDRSSSEVEESSDSSKDSTSFGIGSLELDPQAAFARSSESSDSRLGGSDGIRDSSSSSRAAGSASAPLRFDGFTFANDSERESAERDASTATDGDRSVTSDSQSAQRDTSSTELGGGGFAVAPGAAFERSDARESSRLGDEDGLRGSESTSGTAVNGQAPFSFEGLSGSTQSTSERVARDEDVAVDGDRSVREVTEEASSSARGFAASGGAFEGEPSFGFAQEQADESSSIGDLVRGGSSASTEGFLAGPFSGGAFDAVTESADASQSASLEQVVDGDRSVERVETEQSQNSDTSVFGFDGFSGNPSGSFDSERQQLTDLFRH